LAMFMLSFPLWAMWGAMPAFFCELFPEQLRYTGISLGSQISTIIGGLVPMFATASLAEYGTWPISALVVISAVLGMSSLYCVSAKARATMSLTKVQGLPVADGN